MHILTFDIEEWFHILDNASTKTSSQWSSYEYRVESSTERLLALLAKHNQRGTFFLLGWVAREFPRLPKRISDLGFEVASHSDQHQLAYEQTPEEFTRDLDRSIKTIEDSSGKKVRTYRAPGFSLTERNPWVFDVLIEHGIEIDCSVFPAGRAHGGFPSFGHARPTLVTRQSGSIKEFPINVFRVGGVPLIFSGGGYFRMLPYPMTRSLMRRSEYVMTYFHPRDFDHEQPMIDDLPLTRKLKSYIGIKGAFQKLDRLLTDFKFVDVAQADRNTDWDRAHRISL